MFSKIVNAFGQANAVLSRRPNKQTEIHASQIFAARIRLVLYIMVCGSSVVLTVISLFNHTATGLLICSLVLLVFATWVKIDVEVTIIDKFSEWEQNIRKNTKRRTK